MLNSFQHHSLPNFQWLFFRVQKWGPVSRNDVASFSPIIQPAQLSPFFPELSPFPSQTILSSFMYHTQGWNTILLFCSMSFTSSPAQNNVQTPHHSKKVTAQYDRSDSELVSKCIKLASVWHRLGFLFVFVFQLPWVWIIANESPKSTGGWYGDSESDNINISTFVKEINTWNTE